MPYYNMGSSGVKGNHNMFQPEVKSYNNTYPRNSKGTNSVPYAKLHIYKDFGLSKVTVLFIGIVLGFLIPLAIDFLLFGSIQPCHTVTRFEDGSSTQSCEVRK